MTISLKRIKIGRWLITIRRWQPQDDIPDKVIERTKDLEYRRCMIEVNGLREKVKKSKITIDRLNAMNFAQYRIIREYSGYVSMLCKMLKKCGQHIPADIAIYNEEVKNKLLKK